MLTRFLLPATGPSAPADPVPTNVHASTLAVGPDGKITVAGTVNSSIGLARYNPDGSPASFGNAGQRFAPEINPEMYSWASDVVPLPDGRTLVVGLTNLPRGDAPGSPSIPVTAGTLAAFNADGTLHGEFGGGGDGFVPQRGAGFHYAGVAGD